LQGQCWRELILQQPCSRYIRLHPSRVDQMYIYIYTKIFTYIHTHVHIYTARQQLTFDSSLLPQLYPNTHTCKHTYQYTHSLSFTSHCQPISTSPSLPTSCHNYTRHPHVPMHTIMLSLDQKIRKILERGGGGGGRRLKIIRCAREMRHFISRCVCDVTYVCA